MLKNRSVPADVVLPHITYQSVADALVWLAKTFGFVEHYRYGEPGGLVQGAQMHLGDAWIMLNSARPLNSARRGSVSPAQAGYGTQSLTIFVEDVDAHFERTRLAGARIVEDLNETAYGERQYGVEDLEGHHWLFSRHVRNVSPEEWGATLAGPAMGGLEEALAQAADLKEVEGHKEWTWTPRSYTVQTDPGAVTGSQATIYTLAKVAFDQSLPLLDGLYSLVPKVEPEALAKAQAMIRSQLTALVDEFGVAGGPRVSRVDQLFELLLGPGNPANPEEVPNVSSLGLLRQLLGLEREYVNSVDDEQNLTNYRILVDYLIRLQHSWPMIKDDKG